MNRPRLALLTGATGFVGRCLGPALAQAGWSVRAVARDPARARATLPFAASVCRLDDPELLHDVDAVMHLMGEPVAEGRWTAAKKRRIRDSRVESTRLLADAIAAATRRPEVFLQASAVGYYGDRGDQPLDEAQARGTGFLAQVCTEWESVGLRLADLGVRAVALRLGMVLGKGGGALPTIARIYRRGGGAILGTGEQWLSWIHLDDLVALILHALATPDLRGPVNAVAPQACRYRELHAALLKATRRPSLLPPAPAFALRLLLGDKAAIVLDSARALPRAAETTGFRWRYRSIEAAVAAALA